MSSAVLAGSRPPKKQKNAQRLVELQENALQPIVQVSLDFRSRYQLVQARLSNVGASAAYNVNVSWDQALTTSKGQVVEFGPAGVLPVLAPKDNASILLGQSVDFLKQNPEATWSGTIAYQNASGDRKLMPFTVTGEHERIALVHDQEEPKTHYQLQQLPDALEKIGSELEILRRMAVEVMRGARVTGEPPASTSAEKGANTPDR